jgi:hypothetical protein
MKLKIPERKKQLFNDKTIYMIAQPIDKIKDRKMVKPNYQILCHENKFRHAIT